VAGLAERLTRHADSIGGLSLSADFAATLVGRLLLSFTWRASVGPAGEGPVEVEGGADQPGA